MIVKLSNIKRNYCCIYKLNYPNGKIYVGQTVDLIRRMWEHNNPIKAVTPADLAIKKYGVFTEVEILEEITDISLLNERECYWIKFYNSNNKKIGYNLTAGGKSNSTRNYLTDDEVLDIRKRRYNNETRKSVYNDYKNKISLSGFDRIWEGYGYNNVGQEFLIHTDTNTNRKHYVSIANEGLNNGRAKATYEDIIAIREEYDSGTRLCQIQQKFNQYSKNTIRRIALRESFKNIK